MAHPGGENEATLFKRLGSAGVGVALGATYSFAIYWVGLAVNEAYPRNFIHLLIAESPFGLGGFLWPLVGAALAFRDRRTARIAIFIGLFLHYAWFFTTFSSGSVASQAELRWSVSEQPSLNFPALAIYFIGQVGIWVMMARGFLADASRATAVVKSKTQTLVERTVPDHDLPPLDEAIDYRYKDAWGQEASVSTYRELAVCVRRRQIKVETEVFDPVRSVWVTAGEIEELRPFLERASYIDPNKEDWVTKVGRPVVATASKAGRWGHIPNLCAVLCFLALGAVLVGLRLQPVYVGNAGFSVAQTAVWTVVAAVLAFVVWQFDLGTSRFAWVLTFTGVFVTATVLQVLSGANAIRTTKNALAFFALTQKDFDAGEGQRITWLMYGKWCPVIAGAVRLDQESKRLVEELHDGFDEEWLALGGNDPKSPKIISSRKQIAKASAAVKRMGGAVDETEGKVIALHGEFLGHLGDLGFPEQIVGPGGREEKKNQQTVGDIGPAYFAAHRDWINLSLELLGFLGDRQGRYYLNQERPIFSSPRDSTTYNSLVRRLRMAQREAGMEVTETKQAITTLDPDFASEGGVRKDPSWAPGMGEMERLRLTKELREVIRENEYALCAQHCGAGDCKLLRMRVLQRTPEEARIEIAFTCEADEISTTALLRKSGDDWLLVN